MAWDNIVKNNINNINKELLLAGGQDKIDKHHSRGKLTARERLQILYDNGKFSEIEMYSKTQIVVEGNNKKNFLGDGVICAYGFVNGEVVYTISEDATISGGASGVVQLEKMCRTLEKAISTKKPFVMLCESGGARIEEGIMALSAHSKLFKLNAKASGYIPQIAAIMGNCAGGSAYSPSMCDFVFMVKNTGQYFITGPKVVKATSGVDVTMEELGGAGVHSEYSGQAHFLCNDDQECIENIKQLLQYITVKQYNGPVNCKINYKKLGEEIENIVPDNSRYPYDVKDVICRIVDEQKYIESLPDFAKSIVTAFARIDGKTVGIVANQAKFNGGAICCDAADKCARFVRFCDCFEIPLLTLVDVPGFMPGIEQERKGILRHGSKILFAYAEATVPQITLVIRKAYGGAYCAMDSKELGSDIVFAWPICEFAVMGPEGAVDVIYHKQLSEVEDKVALRNKLIREYEEKYLNPYYAAKCGMVDEVILPEETREKIIIALKVLEQKKVNILQKKHGNITL